ncbi:MAG: hypothetical protein ACFCBW_20725 [Candidatus Competibacterales bacterium]
MWQRQHGWWWGIVLLWGGAISAPAGAITLAIDPMDPSVPRGDSFAIDVNVSGLGDGAAPSLAFFAIQLNYDVDTLTIDPATDVDFGPFLSQLGAGADDVFNSITFTDTGISFLLAGETSFLSAAELDAIQPDAFTLFTATFGVPADVSAAGTPLTFDQAVTQLISPEFDENFDPIELTVDTFVDASVSFLEPPPPGIPLPPTAWLMAAVLGVWGMGRRA